MEILRVEFSIEEPSGILSSDKRALLKGIQRSSMVEAAEWQSSDPKRYISRPCHLTHGLWISILSLHIFLYLKDPAQNERLQQKEGKQMCL